jgi:hypothetical protein
VQKDWRNKLSQLRDFGFREDEYWQILRNINVW